jgi:hypothetical protein
MTKHRLVKFICVLTLIQLMALLVLNTIPLGCEWAYGLKEEFYKFFHLH